MFFQLGLLLALLAPSVHAKTFRSLTPPMGWNSYNAYTCDISEDKVKLNAQGLVDKKLKDIGYTIVTTDCAWNARERDIQGRMQWNSSTFPSGGKALGDFLHNRGLKFGLYSGAGYLQCNPYPITGSLGHEDEDTKSFAEWGGDTLKYDNCYAANAVDQGDNGSPMFTDATRFQKMAASLNKVDRDIQYFLCQWGLGDNVGDWASEIANTWRMSADIGKDWASIWRITNQVVPYARNAAPGQFPDMDMLIVGLNVLTPEEEAFHFQMWAINKSPLIIGAILDDNFPEHSLEILSKKEIIAINQDQDGKPAHLVRRYTEEEWDVWLGDLHGEKQVLGVANWRNESRNVQFDLRSLGIEAAKVRDPRTPQELGRRAGLVTFDLKVHEMKLWVLSDIEKTQSPRKSTGYHGAANATLTGSAILTVCNTCQSGSRVQFLGKGSTATFHSIAATCSDKKLLAFDFVNFDHTNSNIRNVNIGVNGGAPKKWAVPLSGQSWVEDGRLTVEVDGFKKGDNVVVFSGVGDGWAPDVVGLEVLE